MSTKKDFIARKIAEFQQARPDEARGHPDDNIASFEDDAPAHEDNQASPGTDEAEDGPSWDFEVINLKCN